jgi:hypothetical protein
MVLEELIDSNSFDTKKIVVNYVRRAKEYFSNCTSTSDGAFVVDHRTRNWKPSEFETSIAEVNGVQIIL